MTAPTKAANNIQTAWYPYQRQRICFHGIADGETRSFQLQRLTPWATLVALGVSFVAVAMLITIYISMPSTTLSASSLDGSSTSSAAKPNDSCKCEGHSDESLLFAYGEEVNDYRVTSFPVIYPVNAYLEYTLLGANEMKKPLQVVMSDQGPMVSIMHSSSITYVMFYFGHELTLGVDTLAFHRKASAADKAMFDCLIPNFKTKEAYVLTWANATTKDGFVLGACQAVVAFAEDSTTYVIKKYGPRYMLPVNNDDPGFHNALDGKTKNSYDVSWTTNQVRGKRFIIAASEPVFGDNLVHVKEEKYGPC